LSACTHNMEDEPEQRCAIDDLPTELLQHALVLCSSLCSPVQLVATCSRVSRSWRVAVRACEHELLLAADFSSGQIHAEKALRCLAPRGALRLCKEVDLSDCAALHDSALSFLTPVYAPRLSSLCLGGCKRLTSPALAALLRATPQLRELDLSRSDLAPSALSDVLAAAAQLPLTRLRLASCSRLSTASLRCLSAPDQPLGSSLLSLDLESAGCATATPIHVDLEALQRAMLSLEQLRLSGLAPRGGWLLSRPGAQGPGWPRLVLCHLSASRRLSPQLGPQLSHSPVNDAALHRALWASSGLRELALGGTGVTCAGVGALAATAPQRLYLEHSSASAERGCATLLASRWSESLVELNLSSASSKIDNDALGELAACRRLRSLDVSLCPRVTDRGLRLLLAGAAEIEDLQVTGCRSLSRRVRVAGAEGMRALRRELRAAAAE